jgi:hypothetical protein
VRNKLGAISHEGEIILGPKIEHLPEFRSELTILSQKNDDEF